MTTVSMFYRLYCFTDVHVGSGTGLPGMLDSLVTEDLEGFAFIPASQIKGLVKDSCYKLLDRLPNFNEKCAGQKKLAEMKSFMEDIQLETFCNEHEADASSLCPMCLLFGSPRTSGRLWFSKATYGSDYRDNVLGASVALVDRDRAASAHASIDWATGRAEEHHLFSLETVRLPQFWEGHIDFQMSTKLSDDFAQQLRGLLAASLLLVRRVGGRRRRGWGRCRFELPIGEDVKEVDRQNNQAARNALRQLLTLQEDNAND
jgi:CRISPR-associated protein Csx10